MNIVIEMRIVDGSCNCDDKSSKKVVKILIWDNVR